MHIPKPEGLVARPMSKGDAALMLAQLEPWNDDKGAKRAEAYIDFASEQDSTRLAALLLRGAFLETRGDEAAALASVQQALERESDNLDALAAMLQLHMSDAAVAEGISEPIDDWLGTLERNATSAYHFAVAAWWTTYVRGDVPRGAALAKRAIELDGTNFMAYVNWGDAAASLGQLDRALEAYLAALALSRHQVGEARQHLEARVWRFARSLGIRSRLRTEA